MSLVVLSGCTPDPGLPSDGSSRSTAKPITYSFTLTQSEFDQLSPEDQYMVVNKAMSTFMRGMPADEFFDTSQGLVSPVVRDVSSWTRLQTQLQTPLTSEELLLNEQLVFGFPDDPETTEDDSIPALFTSFDDNQPHQIYVARFLGYPLSHDQFSHWMAYFLANTIMFSPAYEMESTDHQDISRTLGYLQTHIDSGSSVQTVIRGWLHNLSRWRVSRSAENHALEMLELYLGIFNDSEEEQQNTINGGKACAPWSLTDASDNYQLDKDPLIVEGVKAYRVFDQYVSTCDELYDAVVGHPNLMPRVTEVIVNYFLDGSSAEIKNSLISDIVRTGPQTFDDIFLSVIFSEAFLLYSERPKTFEENAFGFLGAMSWSPRSRQWPIDHRTLQTVFHRNSSASVALRAKGWAPMEYKIGRTPFVPLDVLSFASYHKGIRESILLNTRAWDGERYPEESDFTEAAEPRDAPFEIKHGAFYQAGTENLKQTLEDLTAEEMIDYIFLSALGRRATEDEMDTWIAEGLERYMVEVDEDGNNIMRKTNGDRFWEYYTDDYAEIILDYITRLPEFYYYRAVTQ
ncbi:hypothetical protein HF888_01590 [Bermanella marisrubri]|nr:hypothetical protein [Bermanella marisrubri]QIZ83003.1 hypothetical protein HF888_01590 [Bermanella marisrubri]